MADEKVKSITFDARLYNEQAKNGIVGKDYVRGFTPIVVADTVKTRSAPLILEGPKATVYIGIEALPPAIKDTLEPDERDKFIMGSVSKVAGADGQRGWALYGGKENEYMVGSGGDGEIDQMNILNQFKRFVPSDNVKWESPKAASAAPPPAPANGPAPLAAARRPGQPPRPAPSPVAAASEPPLANPPNPAATGGADISSPSDDPLDAYALKSGSSPGASASPPPPPPPTPAPAASPSASGSSAPSSLPRHAAAVASSPPSSTSADTKPSQTFIKDEVERFGHNIPIILANKEVQGATVQLSERKDSSGGKELYSQARADITIPNQGKITVLLGKELLDAKLPADLKPFLTLGQATGAIYIEGGAFILLGEKGSILTDSSKNADPDVVADTALLRSVVDKTIVQAYPKTAAAAPAPAGSRAFKPR